MKLVLIIGSNPNQIALANKIANEFNVVAVVRESRIVKKDWKSAKWWTDKIASRTITRPLHNAWAELQTYYREKYESLPPGMPVLEVSSVNDTNVSKFLHQHNANLLAVSGTSLIRKPLIEAFPEHTFLNLHTGISPYVRGGPNCTNWCLANQTYHLIGNSIMWLSAGIDSGDLLLTEATSLTGNESLAELHIQVMEHAHECYLRVLKKIAYTDYRLEGIPQKSLPKGDLFLTKHWNIQKQRQAIHNFSQGSYRNTIHGGLTEQKRANIILVNQLE